MHSGVLLNHESLEMRAYKKLSSISIFLLLFYTLPLIGAPSLLGTWPLLTLAFFCTVLFATQPPLSVKDSRAHKGTDGWTTWLIIGVSGFGQIFSLVEWAYFRGSPQLFDAWAISGLALLTFGTAFRLWAIRTLDRAFSATVQIKVGQQLVTSGPYRWLRHPSYTGALLAMIGAALLMHSYFGLVLMGPGMLLVYMRRIAVEESALERWFGDQYRALQMVTKRLVPFIW